MTVLVAADDTALTTRRLRLAGIAGRRSRQGWNDLWLGASTERLSGGDAAAFAIREVLLDGLLEFVLRASRCPVPGLLERSSGGAGRAARGAVDRCVRPAAAVGLEGVE
ncbi:MAG: hypothetical protein ACXIU8_03110 [Alkalilacustris sp.]